jgi:flagellin-like hook-associated protein FlgL
MTKEKILKIAHLTGAIQALDQVIRVQSDFTGKLQQQREKLQEQVNDLQEVDK